MFKLIVVFFLFFLLLLLLLLLFLKCSAEVWSSLRLTEYTVLNNFNLKNKSKKRSKRKKYVKNRGEK